MRAIGSVGDPAIVRARPDRAWMYGENAVKGVCTVWRRPPCGSLVARCATPWDRTWHTIRRSDSNAYVDMAKTHCALPSSAAISTTGSPFGTPHRYRFHQLVRSDTK